MYKRIIPCLDIKGKNVVKGVKFNNIVSFGSAVEISENYFKKGADEIVILNIAKEKISCFFKTVKKISKKIFVPLTVGGNILDINDVKLLFNSGADKVCLNSTLYYNPSLIKEIKSIYGSQCIVASMDVKKKGREWFVYINGSRTNTGYNIFEWIKKNEKNGVGEILLTSIDKDGNKKGYDYNLYKKVSKITNLPIIASGGAGSVNDILKLFKKTKINSALAAGIFHRKDVSLKKAKKIISKYFRIRE
ncbi:Imidazole glycerol phosphate synthase cyclase subunit [Candidatus Vidania fulgoroideae]|nr:Imidazole glycerol phosphate synthase cyclase subunit [Candidatus Vidania fulgoroideae]